jgi:hypothetical protein
MTIIVSVRTASSIVVIVFSLCILLIHCWHVIVLPLLLLVLEIVIVLVILLVVSGGATVLLLLRVRLVTWRSSWLILLVSLLRLFLCLEFNLRIFGSSCLWFSIRAFSPAHNKVSNRNQANKDA